MNRERNKAFPCAVVCLMAFILWTVVVSIIDVQPIGPFGSRVGFAELNQCFHNLTGVHMTLYTVTDWLSLVPIGFVIYFGLLGLVQWIKREQISKVDIDILALGGFYVAVMAAYLQFEVIPINYRPVLINGILEASYPSSTTLLVLCIMPTAIMQLNSRIQITRLRRCLSHGLSAFTAFMVIGRLLSGVHWLTDIIGGALLSAGLVLLYAAVMERIKK